ncbi:MAG: hypothetical protein ACI845_001806 [Gammaproteobacteria bacterium]|jgi:hypothetical protein
MNLSIKQTALFLILILPALGARAVNFDSFDPKSMAMGGAGVAVADPAVAAFFNPALLSIAEQDDDFAIEFPVLGGRFGASDGFIDNIDGTEDLANDLSSEVSRFNDIVQTNGTVTANETTNLTTSINAMNNKILSLDNSNLNGSGGFGFVLAIPSESFGLALSFSASGSGVGQFLYNDSQIVSDFTTDIDSLGTCFDGSTISDQAVRDCIQVTDFEFVETNPDSLNFGQTTFDTDDSLQSEISILAIGVAEFGVSISREFEIAGSDVAIGITPKSVSISVIDYTASAQAIDSGGDDINDYSKTYNDFNMDIGFAKDFDNGWRVGSTIKNIISQEYETKNPQNITRIIEISPQIRAGASYQNDWTTFAVDLDLTENDAFGSLTAGTSQYLALGLELNVWDITQLRAGYRSDLSNRDRNVVSVGFGISPLGFHFDLALAIGQNSDDGGFAIQTGFRF